MAKSIIKRDFDFKSKLRKMQAGGYTETDRPVVGFASGGLLQNYQENKQIPEVQQAMGLRGTLAARDAELANPEAGRPPVMQSGLPPSQPALPSIPNLTNQDFAALGQSPVGGAPPSFAGALRDRLRFFGKSGFADGGLAEAPMTDVFTKRAKLLDDPAAVSSPPPAMTPKRPALPSVPNLSNEQFASLGKNPMGTAVPTFMGALRDRWGGTSGYGKGGKVAGPGGPTDDKVPAMLSDGEYVLPAKTVEKVGVSRLDKLVMKTNKKVPVHLQKKPSLRKFESGGMLDDVSKLDLVGKAKAAVGRMFGPAGMAANAAGAGFDAYKANQPVAVPGPIAPLKPTVLSEKPGEFKVGGPSMTPKVADVSGETEKALSDAYTVAADRAQAPFAPGLTPQNLRRFDNFERVRNPLAGVHGSSFMGSLFQGAINKGDNAAAAYNNAQDLARAEAQSRAIAAENASKNTRFGTQMHGYGVDAQQRGQDIQSGLRSKEMEIQDRYNTGQLENQRLQRQMAQMQYQRAEQEKAQEEIGKRAQAQASTLGSDGKVITDPTKARRYEDFTRSSFPAAVSSTVDPATRAQARTNAGANFELADQGTQDKVNWIGRVAQALGTLPMREDYPQAVQMPMSSAPAGPATWAEKFMNSHIPFWGRTNVVRNEQGVPFNVGANTDLLRAKERAQTGYERGGLVKKRGLRRG